MEWAIVPPDHLLPLRFDRVGFRAGGANLLEDVSFTLEEGPVSVILGPNGAGKSLTLRIAHGLIEPSSGSAVWAGGGEYARAQSTLVFQRPVLLRRSARANVEYALRLRRLPRAECRRRAVAALEALGLGGLAERPARLLSGGENRDFVGFVAWTRWFWGHCRPLRRRRGNSKSQRKSQTACKPGSVHPLQINEGG